MRTLVGVVLDRSGSMASVLKDTIGGFNSFIEQQRDGSQDQVYVVTQFDNEYEVLQDGVELDDVLTLSERNYIPRGSTALLDAMGQTIARMDAVMANDLTIEQSVLVVLTDGDENSSQEFTRDVVFKLIEDRRAGGKWDFVFLGAGQDAISQARSMGIANAAQYNATGPGTVQAMNAISRSVTNYSLGGSAEVDLDDDGNDQN